MTAAVAESRKPDYAITAKDGMWLAALAILASGQLLIGTDPYYTLLVIVFTALWLLCVKVCGGLKTLTGMAIGYLGFQHVVCSQFAKLLFGQRPDSPLLQPILTMEVYVVGIAATLAACLLAGSAPFSRIRPILSADVPVDKLRVLAYLSVCLMTIRYMGSPQLGVGGIRFLMNFDFISPLAAASITAYQVLRTEGRKFLHPLSYWVVAVPFLISIIGFQRKEAVYAVIIIIAVAIAYGYRFKPIHFAMGFVLLYFFQFIFFPFALYYRGNVKKSNDVAANFGRAWDALAEVIANPMEYQEEDKYRPTSYDATRLLYYDMRPSPTLDRMTTIIITDALVHSAEQGNIIGWKSIADGFDMLMPSIINEDKQIRGTSNWIAHQAPGMLTPTDQGTQITMGYFAEAYMSFKMIGVVCVSFLVAFGFILVVRIAMGDALKNNLWTCAWIVTVPWNVSEGPVQLNVIVFLQSIPLFVALSILFLIISNSMSRSPDPDKDRLEQKPVFKDEGLRLAG